MNLPLFYADSLKDWGVSVVLSLVVWCGIVLCTAVLYILLLFGL